MEKFYNLKCRAYPHTKLNSSKGVVRSKEWSLATLEEIEMAFKKKGIKEYRRVTIRRNDKTIQTHTYIAQSAGAVEYTDCFSAEG